MLGYISVQILISGTYVTMSDKSYVVLTTELYQDNDGEIGQIYTLLPVDDKGDETGEDAIRVNPDMYDIAVN